MLILMQQRLNIGIHLDEANDPQEIWLITVLDENLTVVLEIIRVDSGIMQQNFQRSNQFVHAH